MSMLNQQNSGHHEVPLAFQSLTYTSIIAVVFCTLPYINKLSFLWTHPDFRVRHDEDTPSDDGCKRQIEYKM